MLQQSQVRFCVSNLSQQYTLLSTSYQIRFNVKLCPLNTIIPKQSSRVSTESLQPLDILNEFKVYFKDNTTTPIDAAPFCRLLKDSFHYTLVFSLLTLRNYLYAKGSTITFDKNMVKATNKEIRTNGKICEKLRNIKKLI